MEEVTQELQEMQEKENQESQASQEQKTVGVWQKITAFLDKHYALFFAPIIVAFVYIFALWQYDVYPFGDTYTAASYDLSAQIAPFIEHIFDVFDGKSTLSFSYAIVGGADVTGTFLYFFVSPFSFLFLIFGDGMVAQASSIVMLCKLMTISVAGTWFAQKLFKGIPDYLCIGVGIAYAYCGYTFVANTYINWLDFLIYMPFCVAAFRHFVTTGKFLPFSILLACCIYTCFSIACFAMFTVFPVLVCYGLLCVDKGEKHKFIAYLSLSFVVAVLMALPILFPALGSYTVSGRGGDLFENLWNGFSYDQATGVVGEFDKEYFLEWWGDSLYTKWSYIFADSIFVILTFVWFFRKGLKDKFAQFMLVAGVLTTLPLIVDESMNLLNMGSYMSYALRFGFLNAIYFLGGACLCLENLCYKPFAAMDGRLLFDVEKEGKFEWKRLFAKENRKSLLFAGGIALVGAVVSAFILWFGNGKNHATFLSWLGVDGEYSSSAYAHSLGGLEVTLVLFVCVALVTIVGVCFVDAKRISPRLLSYVLLVVVGVQVAFYNGQLVLGNRSVQHLEVESYQYINADLNERTDGHFRVKDYDDYMTACVPFAGNANSFSVFSSVIDKDNFTVLELFGYKGNGKNTFKSAHNQNKKNRADAFGDSFLGYKYFLSTKSNLHTQEEVSEYVKPVYVLDENGNEKLDEKGEKIHLCHGELYAYENKYVFPMAYKVDATQGGFTFAVENKNNSANRKENQEALYKYLRGEELAVKYNTHTVHNGVVRELSAYLSEKAAKLEVGAGTIKATVTAEKDENLLLNFVAVNGYTVTVNGKKAELIDNDLNFLLVGLEEGENEVVFTYTSPYGKYALLGVAAGVVGLLAVAFVLKKTKWVDKLAPVISWAGIGLSVAVVAFFMIYPTGVFLSKIAFLLK